MNASEAELMRRLKRENRRYRRESERDRAQIEGMGRQLELERRMWPASRDDGRRPDAEDAASRARGRAAEPLTPFTHKV